MKLLNLCFSLPKRKHRNSPSISNASHSSSAAPNSGPQPGTSIIPLQDLTQSITTVPSSTLCEGTQDGAGPVSLPRLTSNLAQEIQQVFAQFDANHDGKISVEELCTVLQSLGVETACEDAKLMVEEADANGDGFIDLQEFMELHREHMAQDELRATFEIFDLNNDGHITAQELYSVLTNLGDDGHNTSLEDCNRMICRVDRKGVGHVDLDDFKLLMMNV